MIREELQQVIFNALGKEFKLPKEEILLEHPGNSEHGDYSTNIALVLAQKLGKSPCVVAEEIRTRILNTKYRILNTRIDKVEVAGPGFINFFLSKEYLLEELKRIAREKDRYGAGKEKRKVIVEFTDPNPFKEFHIGHLYSNTVGESLSRLLEATGAKVWRVNYQGDIGLHVAKAIWGMDKEMQKEGTTLKAIQKKSLEERVKFLGKSYATGTEAYEEDEKAKQEMGVLNAKIFASEKSVQEMYQKGRTWSLKAFEKIYKRLGTTFDQYYFESKVGPLGVKVVEEGLKQGIFEKTQGAVTFPGEKYGLHRRVFINSQGLPTYEAKDLGLAPTKYKDFPYDQSLIITGNEQKGYFQVLIEALQKMYPKLGEKTRHLSHGMVRLPAGKMSSRTGNVIGGEDLLDEVKSRVLKLMNTSGSEVSAKEREKTAEMIAVGAVKYSLLRVSLGKDIAFDFEKSLSLEGDSGPYLQYTYARCKSILRKAKVRKLSSAKFVPMSVKLSRAKLSKEEMVLLRLLYRFGEVVQEAAEKFSPNLVAQFAFDLAQKYNLFYNTRRVLEAETKEAKDFRLLLTTAVAQILKNSLSLLGIKTPERM